MNKRGTIIASMIILLVLASFLVQAEEDFTDSLENANKNIQEKTEDLSETIEETQDKLNPEQIKNEYLKKEWKEFFLRHNLFGPIIKVIDAVFTFLNPFFKLALKIEYSLSWAFIIGLILWTTILIFIYKPASAIVNNDLLGFVMALAITSLIGYSGAIKFSIDMLATLVPNKWVLIIAIIVTLVAAIIIIKAGGGLKKMIEKQKEKEEKTKEKEAKELSHLEAEAKRMEHGLK